MVASPQPIDLQAQINALNKKVNNLISSPRPVNTVAVGQPIVAANGTVLLQADPLGGLAYPWYAVPLLQLFIGPTGPNSTTTYPNGSFTQSPSQGNSTDTNFFSKWFAGFLPYVSHPRIQIQTFIETASVGGTVTMGAFITTNNFASFTTVGTWVENQFNGQFTTNVFDMTPYLGLTGVGFGLGPISITGSAGFVSVQPYGCFLRGSV